MNYYVIINKDSHASVACYPEALSKATRYLGLGSTQKENITSFTELNQLKDFGSFCVLILDDEEFSLPSISSVFLVMINGTPRKMFGQYEGYCRDLFAEDIKVSTSELSCLNSDANNYKLATRRVSRRCGGTYDLTGIYIEKLILPS